MNDVPPPPANRLSIAHLLLWTATTAIVLGFIRQIAPHYTPTSATTAQYALNLWLQYLLLFAVSPACGAALGGLVLAAWRLWTRRFGFPSQPGHWLLIVLSVIPLAASTNWVLRLAAPGADFVVGCVSISALTLLSFAAATQTRRPMRWLLAFALATGGLGGMAMALFAGYSSPPYALLPAILGGLSVVSSIMAGLAAGILDLTSNERYDAFHWIGVVTLATLAASPLLSWLIALATMG